MDCVFAVDISYKYLDLWTLFVFLFLFIVDLFLVIFHVSYDFFESIIVDEVVSCQWLPFNGTSSIAFDPISKGLLLKIVSILRGYWLPYRFLSDWTG